MQKILSLLFVIIPGLLISQALDPVPAETAGNTGNQIIYMESTDDGGMRFFMKKKKSVSGKGITETGEQMFTNMLEVFTMDSEGKVTDEPYLFYNPVFPTKKKWRMDVSFHFKATQDDVLTYESATEKYPGLKNVRALDKNNWDIPEVQYETWIKKPFFKDKINGLMCSEMKKAPYNSVTQTKGLMGGLNKLNAKLEGKPHAFTESLYKYDRKTITDLDWEKKYNGKQDKKNFWKVLYHNHCNKTGNLIAYTSHKLKDDDTNEYKSKELMLFDKKGKELSKSVIKTDIPWQFVKGRSHSKMDGLNKVLTSAVVVEKQYITKKVNNDGNKNQLKFTTIQADGSMSDLVVDLPFEAYRVDTLMHMSNARTVLVGGDRNKYHSYVVDLNNGKANVYKFDHDTKSSKIYIHSLMFNKDEVYINYWRDGEKYTSRGVDVYHLKDGNIDGPKTIKPVFDKMTRWSFAEFYSDADNLLVFVKEEVDEFQGYRFCTVPRIYKLSGMEFTPLNDPETDLRVFGSLEVLTHNKPFLYKDHLYYYGVRIEDVERAGKMSKSLINYFFNVPL